MVLSQIVAHKKSLVENFSIDHQKLKKSDRSLLKALMQQPMNFICEVKLGSPSLGLLKANADIKAIAKTYEPFAAAISVLADEKFFFGSMDNVKAVRSVVSCPVLCKDIIVSPIQVYQARNHDADAILLMLSVLNDEDYIAYKKIAEELCLDVVTEIHNEEEAIRAKKLNAKIIGINNRDLNTLFVDLDVTKKLLPLIDKDVLVISESGFSTHEQIKKYIGKVDGFLIGSSLMRSNRVDLSLRELIFGRVKICGLTNPQDAWLSYEAGAYYGGLNFIPNSKRVIDTATAKKIVESAPLVYGGIFADMSVDDIISITKELRLSFIQLHGHEDKSFIRELRRLLPFDCEIFKCVKVKDAIDWDEDFFADLILFDNFSEKELGGTGKNFDWNLLKDRPTNFKFILAGGLNEKNIEEASNTGAFVLDIASFAEENPRKKSKEKLESIFSKLKGFRKHHAS